MEWAEYKDIEVHKGDISKSVIRSCKLKWDNITVNSEELALTAEGSIAFNPINRNGVFDSGKPINSWEGNDVEGVSVTDNTATFSGISNPTKISITFTISEIMFTDKPVKTYLLEKLDEAEKLDSTKYSSEAWKSLETTMEKARELLQNEESEDLEMTSAYWNIEKAIASLGEVEASTDSVVSSEPTEEFSPDKLYIIIAVVGVLLIGGVAAIVIINKRKKQVK